jgi:glycosyltransferase involved in cell wall biosynthesis
MNKILIVAHYSGSFSSGEENNRFNYLYEMLKELKDSTEFLTSDFTHKHKVKKISIEDINDKNITLIPEPGYKSNISFSRLYSHFIFGFNLYKNLARRKNKPSIIYVGFPTPFAAWAVAFYCKKTNIKFIVDIQDIWPEAFMMTLERIGFLAKPLLFPFYALNRYIFSNASSVVSVSKSYLQSAESYANTMIKGTVVYLGTDLSIFDNYSNTGEVFKKNKYSLNLCYVGKLSYSYDLEVAISAVQTLQTKLNIGLHIYGKGPLEDDFKKLVKNNDNIHFYGNLPYKNLPAALKNCDVGMNVIVKSAVQSVTNKHSDYASAGLAIINTQPCKEYRDLLTEYNFGINCEPNNVKDVIFAIKKIYKDKSLLKTYKVNSRKFAEKKMDREATYGEILHLIQSLKDG